MDNLFVAPKLSVGETDRNDLHCKLIVSSGEEIISTIYWHERCQGDVSLECVMAATYLDFLGYEPCSSVGGVQCLGQ
jgi:hypothetical protein